MAGALYVAVVCLLPELLIGYATIPLQLGGTTLLIVVGTVLDIEGQVRHAMFDRGRDGDSRPSDPSEVMVTGVTR